MEIICISITMFPYVLWSFESPYFFVLSASLSLLPIFLFGYQFFLVFFFFSYWIIVLLYYSKYLAMCLSVCWEYTMISTFTGFLMLLVIEVNYGFWCNAYLFTFSTLVWAFGIVYKRSISTLNFWKHTPISLSKTFVFLIFIFRSLIHSELNFLAVLVITIRPD